MQNSNKNKYRGRGTGENPPNRFEKFHVEETEDIYDEHSYEDDSERKIETVFYKDHSKTVISKNNSSDIPFDYSFNPYRGCEHGCVYCYARPTHEFLGFSLGIDFETKIMIKENGAELLRLEFEKKSYVPKLIMFSGDTDCYQPIEKKLEITRKALKVCLEYRNPVSIITKNSLILRDIDILREMAKMNLVTTMLSITSLDKILISKMEPRTATPERKLNTIQKLSEAEIPVGVNIAPVISGLTDGEIPEILRQSAKRGATYASYILLRLPLSLKEIFIKWLEAEFPDRKEKILNKIREMRDGKLNESEIGKRFKSKGQQAEAIRNLFYISCRKYNLNQRNIDLTTSLFKRHPGNQLEMF
ncbi:MAG TPA: PA0069 family radical SAM protein [Ignavibacteriaceae bacterium]|nr:PA0069 family radical SAM protein [Ignavibacteriaceae bacterium]